jgi:hypothetical protein
MKKATAQKRKKMIHDSIVIDEANGLVFGSEDELYAHFHQEIRTLEEEFFRLRDGDDVPENQFSKHERDLHLCLEDPDEVWEDRETLKGKTVLIYMRHVARSDEAGMMFHVAACYVTGDVPSFIYLHFPTRNERLVDKYRRGELVYDRSLRDVPLGALDGDALTEGDPLAAGLYGAMLRLRNGDKDIHEEDFIEFYALREETLSEADEIWRKQDSFGNVLVTFVKDFTDQAEEELYYVVVTLEDSPSNSHALLFSFPTRDRNLIDRYRQGENLQAEEVVQEASH